jgi:hypothetical protein
MRHCITNRTAVTYLEGEFLVEVDRFVNVANS